MDWHVTRDGEMQGKLRHDVPLLAELQVEADEAAEQRRRSIANGCLRQIDQPLRSARARIAPWTHGNSCTTCAGILGWIAS